MYLSLRQLLAESNTGIFATQCLLAIEICQAVGRQYWQFVWQPLPFGGIGGFRSVAMKVFSQGHRCQLAVQVCVADDGCMEYSAYSLGFLQS